MSINYILLSYDELLKQPETIVWMQENGVELPTGIRGHNLTYNDINIAAIPAKILDDKNFWIILIFTCNQAQKRWPDKKSCLQCDKIG